MLKLKILKGEGLGQEFRLKEGDNIVGRAPDCDIIIAANGVSKHHAKLTVQGGGCVVTDLKSSNGTFVNGTRVRDRILRAGDRVGFHNVIAEISAESRTTVMTPGPGVIPGAPPMTPWQGNVAYKSTPLAADPNDQPVAPPKSLTDVLQSYVENVVLPGVYRLGELYPVRNVLGAFLLVFILMVTALSTIPMAELTKEGVQKEAQRRALTIARQLAEASERALASGGESTIRTDFAESEDGVMMALVVAKDDGHIIAPLTKAQSYSTDEFVARGRKHDETFVQQINDTTVGVSVPVHVYSPDAGQQTVAAFAQVVYKADSVDLSGTVALFARILIIALILGAVLFFFLYKLLTRPLVEAAAQLDQALRGERDAIQTKYDFDVFKKFVENINSALGRMSSPSDKLEVPADRLTEASNLVRLMGDAAIALDGTGQIIQINSHFEELTGMRLLTVQGQTLEVLQDQALKLNLQDLINQSQNAPGQIVTGTLDISGIEHEIDLQSSPKSDGEAGVMDYFIAVIKKRGSP